MPHSDIVIIGGGAIGLSSAYYLNQKGFDVTILDSNDKNLYNSCSWGSSGMIVPSHIVPLAAPGVIKKGLKWLLDPESPFSIEFKPSIEMISWLLKFRKAANKKHVKQAADLLRNLSMDSRSLYKKLNEQIDFEFETKGILMLCKGEKTLKEEIAVSVMAQDIGMKAKNLNPAEINKLETGMKTEIAGGVYYPSDAHFNPGLYLSSMKKILINSGVKIFHKTKVHSINIDKEKITSVNTEHDNWKAKKFILCAGSFSSKLVKQIKIKMPLMGGKGYSISIDNIQKKPALPAILVEARIASTPMGKIWRLGGTMTVTQGSTKINNRKLSAMVRNVKKYYPEYNISSAQSLKPWVGLRPLSADGLPYIGPFKKYPNLIAATGHAMLGVSLAPVTGHLVSNIISEESFDYDMKLLSPDRFN
ncbi:MAG: FAD-dependent oxidoreductase [Candidatus Marinimicrobia bacterium]|nr:FAD-dependent oxidoreductase [Candidatus Neomarinimicrobiota bacterium]